MNPLDQYPDVRRVLYIIQWAVTGIQVVVSAFFAFWIGDMTDWPRLYLASLAVTPVLWSYLGITAQKNITKGDGDA